ncbi:uncharacterized protein [Malus domestica]|uniref:uncharacterized protein isoform X2 n=1 Tax=Malus domestica TaxID=3750 RepID=UPI0010AB4560|nr:uncharacterized protein LOC103414279 isoform X1 [Malus domestica]
MDLEPGSSRNSKRSERVVDGSGGSKRSERPKVRDGSDDSSHLTRRPEATANEGGRVPTRKLVSISSLSSLASDSSLEDLFQVDTNRTTTSTHASSLPQHHDSSSVGPASTSRASDVTHGSMVPGLSPTESPSIQMMDRCGGGYDPYRIPSSVFSRSKSNKELEWSVASNESLFSIHLGNNSFSRDHILLLGDLVKSGELNKSGELFALNPAPHVPVVEIESDRIEEVRIEEVKIEEVRIEEVRESGVGVADETIKNTARANAEDHSEGRVPAPTGPVKSPTLSRRSDASGTSTRSFAFPITKKRAWPLRCCSNCSRAFCYVTWPSCYCSNCSWAFCYSWNRFQKRVCCVSSTILSDGMTDRMKSSVKVTQFAEEQCLEPEPQRPPPPVLLPPKKVTKSKASYWLCCFSWCKWGCSCRRRRCRCFSCCCCC